MNKTVINYIEKTIDLILYIANDTEYISVIEYLNEKKIQVVEMISDKNPYKIFKYKDFRFALIKGQDIGAGNSGTINQLIPYFKEKFINYRYLVNVGCCCSFSRDIGTVLWCSETMNYDFFIKNSGSKIPRGNVLNNNGLTKIYCNLIEKIGLFAKKENIKIDYGKFLCQSSVIKDSEYINNLKEQQMNQIGLDMESYYMASLSNNESNWIVIKGVSDNGVNKNGDCNQREATYNSLKFLFFLLDNGLIEKNRIKLFISGAISEKHKKSKEASMFSYKLGNLLINHNFKLINGTGLTIGNSLECSAKDYSDKTNTGQDEVLETFVFPRLYGGRKELELKQHQLRCEKLKDVPIAIFIYGQKDKCWKLPTHGVKDEFDVLNSYYCLSIPLPKTKFSAKKLYRICYSNFESEFERSFYTKIKKISGDALIEEVVIFLNEFDNKCYGAK